MGKPIVQTSLGDISIIPKSKLGEGGFGITKKAAPTDQTYVVKKIPISRSGWKKNYRDFFSVTQEAKLGKPLSNHPNIAKTLDMYVYDEQRYPLQGKRHKQSPNLLLSRSRD